MSRGALGCAILLVSACRSGEPLVSCDVEQLRSCDAIYRPVCGKGDVWSWGATRTYPNACEACASHAIVGYESGTCAAE